MNANNSTPFVDPEAERYDQYRTVSFSAIVTFVFGLLSVPTGLFASQNPFLLLFPFIGMMVGLYSVLRLRSRQQEFTGYGLARLGLVLATVLLLVGTGYVMFVYATEVPDGYERVSFSDLKPDPKYPHIPFAPSAAEIAEKKIFVKGYVYPDEQLGDIKRFILVPDFGACCFGGKPKLHDMMQITLEDPHRVKYSYFLRSLAGTFHLGSAKASKVGEVVYHLEDAIVTK